MRLKRILAAMLAVVKVLVTISVCVVAEEFTDGYYTYTVADNCATLTDCDTSISGDVTIPDTLGGYTVTSIGDLAFFLCDNLTSVTIPDGVISIGDSVFSNCDSLTNINVSENNVAYNSVDGVLFSANGEILIQYPIGKSDTEYAIPDSVISIGDSVFSNCDSLTSVTIPDSVTSIGDSAFFLCDNLTSITIPDSVTDIGNRAFDFCYSLISINVSANNVAYKSIYGVLLSADGEILIQYPNGKSDTEYVIPDSVTSIGDWAFSDCDSLTCVTIPDSVTNIGDSAFRNCFRLTSVTIPDSVTSIGSFAFSDCFSLTSMTIPDSVANIGNSAFSWTSLTIYCYNNSAIHKYSVDYDIPYKLIGNISTPGDATGDGNINLSDVSLILKSIAKWDVTLDIDAADVTGDGNVNLSDVSLILKYIAKWDVTLG